MKFCGLISTCPEVTWGKTDKDLFCPNSSWIGLKHSKDLRVEGTMFLIKKVIKIPLSSNDHKRMQSIDWIETYAYRTTKI